MYRKLPVRYNGLMLIIYKDHDELFILHNDLYNIEIKHYILITR